MKKSTLITTIAMIVVVVVALSTATYAWFSSQTATTVETSITTNATSGWLLYGGSLSGTTLTYSSSYNLDWTLPNGIYSPVAPITNGVGGKTTSTTFTNTPFYNAQITAGEARSDLGLVNDPSDTTHFVAPKFVRVINNEADGADLELTIYVVVPSGSDEKVFRAAAGFKTWISVYAAADNAARTLTTGYNYGPLSESTTGEDAGYYVATIDNNSPAGAQGVVAGKTDSVSSSAAIADSGFYTIQSGDAAILDATGATAGAKVRRITFTVAENMQIATAVNLAFYAWLDGWELDDTASGVEGLQIVYSFGTATV